MQHFHQYKVLSEWYLQHLQITNNSPLTIKTYRFEIRYFRRYLEELTDVEDIEQIDKNTLAGYSAWLFSRGLTTRTISNKLGALASFFRTLYDENKVYLDLSRSIVLPRHGLKLPTNTLTEQEAEMLFERLEDSTADRSCPVLLRDRVMVELLYGTGIRRGELAKLRISDINMSEGLLVIRDGKGKKDRVVPVGSKCITALDEYIDYGRPKLATGESGEVLLLNRWGKQFEPNGLGERMAAILKRAGIKRRIRLHDIRHTCATHMLNRGADIRYVQELLGHSCLSSTQIYTHVSIKKLQETHRKYHPREQNGFIGDDTEAA
jgi:site-specific recombinase XerD